LDSDNVGTNTILVATGLSIYPNALFPSTLFAI
jgi:hypothetical protein